jgi:hypothetical protein
MKNFIALVFVVCMTPALYAQPSIPDTDDPDIEDLLVAVTKSTMSHQKRFDQFLDAQTQFMKQQEESSNRLESKIDELMAFVKSTSTKRENVSVPKPAPIPQTAPVATVTPVISQPVVMMAAIPQTPSFPQNNPCAGMVAQTIMPVDIGSGGGCESIARNVGCSTMNTRSANTDCSTMEVKIPGGGGSAGGGVDCSVGPLRSRFRRFFRR